MILILPGLATLPEFSTLEGKKLRRTELKQEQVYWRAASEVAVGYSPFQQSL